MNHDEARQRVQALKGFYGHFAIYAVFMVFLSVVNFLSYAEAGRIWVIYPLLGWGTLVAVHGLAVFLGSGGAQRWEERKIRELTGWSATREELARLSERVETLLRIVADERDEALDPELAAARRTLIDAREAINRQQSPLEKTDTGALRKREVVELVERLEALLTSRELRRFDDALDRPGRTGEAPARH